MREAGKFQLGSTDHDAGSRNAGTGKRLLFLSVWHKGPITYIARWVVVFYARGDRRAGNVFEVMGES